MNKNFEIRELTTAKEMEQTHAVLLHMYPDLSFKSYAEKLATMTQHNYTQVVAFENNKPIGLSGIWIGTKLWCDRYLEIDNFIIDPAKRNQQIGNKLLEYIEEKAEKTNCNILVLDTYTDNFKAIKLFMNNDFIPRGFHMIKSLNGFTVDGKI
jgi:ribosomal protein S18 acetylase RimI-like enzyme